MRLSVISLVAGLAVGSAAVPVVAQRAAATTTAPNAHDKALSQQIAKRIAEEPGFTAGAVDVKVEDGVVTLSGMVASEADRARAEQLAQVDGVKRVHNNLHTEEGAKSGVKGTAGTAAEKSKNGAEKVAEKAKEGVSKTGEVITDGWITSRISSKFVNEDLLHDSHINVDTKDHIVTLHGTVLSEAGRRRAVAIAKEVEGVHRVIDKITIGPKK
jgi:hyperosmotically inducible periplasmic protein